MSFCFPGEPRTPEDHGWMGYSSVVAVGKYGLAPGDISSPLAIAIDTRTNQIYIVDGDNKEAWISIFSETGEFLNSFSHELMLSPYGLAIYRDNVYVTNGDDHPILHFKLSPDIHLRASVGGCGSGLGEFVRPQQLTVCNNGDIFIADSFNNRIQILDHDLQYKRQISHHTVSKPCDVKLASNLVYVLTSKGSCRVHVFTWEGEKIRSLINFLDEIQDPSTFCLDDKGNLFISDTMADEIKVFSNDGTLVHIIGKYGFDVGMFFYPKGIALISNYKLAVVSRNDKYGLQIFSCY